MIKENMAELLIFLYIMPSLSYRFLPEHESQVLTPSISSNIKRMSINDVPHHVLIVYGSRYCSGTLIGSRTVVTAASCLDNNTDEPIVVKVGSNSMTSMGQIISVIECKIHEYYQYLSGLDNDIALLLLQDHVVFGPNIAKTVIVESEVALRLGTPVKVTGWGGPNLPGKYLNLILQSEMMVADKIECRKQFGDLMTLSNFCVKYNLEGLLSDNGGGARYRELLVGILSYGARDQNSNVAILTNVSYFYRWIMLNTNKILSKHCLVRSKVKDTDNAEYIEK